MTAAPNNNPALSESVSGAGVAANRLLAKATEAAAERKVKGEGGGRASGVEEGVGGIEPNRHHDKLLVNKVTIQHTNTDTIGVRESDAEIAATKVY